MAKKTIKLRRNLQRNREIYPEYTKKKKPRKLMTKFIKVVGTRTLFSIEEVILTNTSKSVHDPLELGKR